MLFFFVYIFSPFLLLFFFFLIRMKCHSWYVTQQGVRALAMQSDTIAKTVRARKKVGIRDKREMRLVPR